MQCHYCFKKADTVHKEEFLCNLHYTVLYERAPKLEYLSEVSKESEEEKRLHKKYMAILQKPITRRVVIEFKRDLKKLASMTAMLICSVTFSQSAIVAAGAKDFTVGEVFPIMQTIKHEKEVSLGVPKFEIPIEIPKPAVKKKENWFIKLLKRIFNIK